MSEHLGSDTFFHVKVDGFNEPLTVRADGEVDFKYGDKVSLSPNLDNLHRFDKEGLRLA